MSIKDLIWFCVGNGIELHNILFIWQGCIIVNITLIYIECAFIFYVVLKDLTFNLKWLLYILKLIMFILKEF